MMETSKAKSNGALILPNKVQRSISPSGRFCSSTISSSSSAFASSTSSFSSPTRSLSPNRISTHRGYVSSSPSLRFSVDHRYDSTGRADASSLSREMNQKHNHGIGNKGWNNGQKKMCICSPTTHPGSFRCSLHKNVSSRDENHSNNATSYHWHRLYDRRSVMTNSLVRIGTVEGDLVNWALESLIRPSSQQQRRRIDFHPMPSRLSVMSKSEE